MILQITLSSADASIEAIEAEFKKFGDCQFLPASPGGALSIEFFNAQEAHSARDALNRKEVGGCLLTIEVSEPPKRSRSRSRSPVRSPKDISAEQSSPAPPQPNNQDNPNMDLDKEEPDQPDAAAAESAALQAAADVEDAAIQQSVAEVVQEEAQQSSSLPANEQTEESKQQTNEEHESKVDDAKQEEGKAEDAEKAEDSEQAETMKGAKEETKDSATHFNADDGSKWKVVKQNKTNPELERVLCEACKKKVQRKSIEAHIKTKTHKNKLA